jgi:molecular chaperone GrpE (heat shock protein)
MTGKDESETMAGAAIMDDPVLGLLGDLVTAIQKMGRQQVRLTAAVESASPMSDQTSRVQGDIEKIALALLDIIDYVDDAIAMARQKEDAPWIDRLERLAAHILRAAQRAGISEIVTDRALVDADVHDVIDGVDDDSMPAGTIRDVVRRGFIAEGRILRRAQVIAVRA